MAIPAVLPAVLRCPLELDTPALCPEAPVEPELALPVFVAVEGPPVRVGVAVELPPFVVAAAVLAELAPAPAVIVMTCDSKYTSPLLYDEEIVLLVLVPL